MDTIADMFIRIKNAQARQKTEVMVPFSRLKFDIANILKREKFVEQVEKVKEGNKEDIRLTFDIEGETRPIKGYRRVSKLGRRVYKGWREMPKVLNGLGIMIVTTSTGVMTDRDARKKKQGGEIICEIF